MIDKMIQKIADKGERTYSIAGVVSSIDESKRTCEVQPVAQGPSIPGVRLQAKEGATKGVLVIPAVGSDVLVSWLDKHTAYVSAYTEIDKIVYANETTDIASLIGELMDTLISTTYTNAAGQTGPPSTLVDLQEIKTKFATLFKE